MELPVRSQADRFTTPGRYRELETQLRRRIEGSDIPILFIYAFDPRTRLGPFVFVDKTLIPGAPRAVGAALYAAGFRNVRLVLQQWNPNIQPSVTRFDGKPPEVLMISAMQIHSAPAYRLIRDAWQLGDDRPLILAGGPKAVYEPWDFFGLSPDGREGADVVVTGEEYVLLELLDRIVEMKGPGDTMRAAFERAREGGLLEDIPGLVYRPDAPDGPPPHLVNTGVQRLVQDLDELPLPLEAMGLFEPPHGRTTLSSQPVPAEQLGRHAKILAMVTTHGCQFHCPYCPIPAYNQFTFRHRSPQRMVEEIAGIADLCGMTKFFGTDDNFFSRRETAEAIARGHGTRQGREQAVPQSDYVCHGGYRVRRAEEPGPLALGPRCGNARPLAGNRRPHGRSGQEGTNRGEDQDPVQAAREAGDCPDADDDAPRRSTAVDVAQICMACSTRCDSSGGPARRPAR